MATTYAILGQAAPADTANTDLYTVGAGKQAVVSTIVVTNIDSASAANATIYIRKNGAAAAGVNTLIKASSVAVADLKALTLGITLGAGDIITVATGTANGLAFHVYGSEIA